MASQMQGKPFAEGVPQSRPWRLVDDDLKHSRMKRRKQPPWSLISVSQRPSGIAASSIVLASPQQVEEEQGSAAVVVGEGEVSIPQALVGVRCWEVGVGLQVGMYSANVGWAEVEGLDLGVQRWNYFPAEANRLLAWVAPARNLTVAAARSAGGPHDRKTRSMQGAAIV